MEKVLGFYEKNPLIKMIYFIANLVLACMLVLSIILPIFGVDFYGYVAYNVGFFTADYSLSLLLLSPILIGIVSCLSILFPFFGSKITKKDLSEKDQSFLVVYGPLISGGLCLLGLLLFCILPIDSYGSTREYLSLAVGGLFIVIALSLGTLINIGMGVLIQLFQNGKVDSNTVVIKKK